MSEEQTAVYKIVFNPKDLDAWMSVAAILSVLSKHELAEDDDLLAGAGGIVTEFVYEARLTFSGRSCLICRERLSEDFFEELNNWLHSCGMAEDYLEETGTSEEGLTVASVLSLTGLVFSRDGARTILAA